MDTDGVTNERVDRVWQNRNLAKDYLSAAWQATPLAREQIDVMLRVIGGALPDGPEQFIDLGCGGGNVGEAILKRWAGSRGIFIDFSQPMLDGAHRKLRPYGERVMLINQDYGDPGWITQPALEALKPFDALVTGYSIHHSPDERKKEIYQEIASLLRPGGIFINIEHVASPTPFIESVYDDLMIDADWMHQKKSFPHIERESVAKAYHERPDAGANILLDVETQLDWLREIGFAHVDCYLKIFELAVFGGIKA